MEFKQIEKINKPGQILLTQKNYCNENIITYSKPESSPWISGFLQTPHGKIPLVKTILNWSDYPGHIKSRISSYRNNFKISPGLYAAGNPDSSSDIFVTANYKMSFDYLRKALNGLNAWILVLDTKGINVWCAAGKGTFSKEELIRQINKTHLKEIAPEGKIILPQLGAPGINIFTAKKSTGFQILYGPIRARDIPEFIKNKYTATASMRKVTFNITERAILIPIELFMIKEKFLFFVAISSIYAGLTPDGIIFKEISATAPSIIYAGILSIFAGAVITPLLLPFIPFRSFAIKGALTGAGILLLADYLSGMFSQKGILFLIANIILFTTLSSYIALQFTGATPFTSLSGVKKEIKYSLPFYAGGILISIIILTLHKITQWGLL